MGKQSICGIVSNKAIAEKIIRALVDAGIDPMEISLLSSQEDALKDEATAQSSPRNWRTEIRIPKDQPSTNITLAYAAKEKLERHTHAAEGATAGATTGSVVGGTLGLLAGIGALAIPGFGPLLAAGPLMAALSGIGAGGAIGSVLGALIGVGIPEKEAIHYTDKLKEGSILLTACSYNDDQTAQILNIFKQQGVRNITSSAESLPHSMAKK